MIMKLIIFLFAIGTIRAGLFQKKVAKIYNMDNCMDYNLNDLKMIVENVSLITDNTRKTLVSFAYRVTDDIEKVIGDVKITKCGNDESLDSCLAFKAMKIDMCAILSASNTAWSSMLSNSEPRLTCPIKKGLYKTENGFLDTEKLPFPFDSNYRWKIITKNIDVKTKKVISCMMFTLQMVPKKD